MAADWLAEAQALRRTLEAELDALEGEPPALAGRMLPSALGGFAHDAGQRGDERAALGLLWLARELERRSDLEHVIAEAWLAGQRHGAAQLGVPFASFQRHEARYRARFRQSPGRDRKVSPARIREAVARVERERLGLKRREVYAMAGRRLGISASTVRHALHAAPAVRTAI